MTEGASRSSGLRAVVRLHPVASFVLLAYAVSWWAWVWYRLDPENVGAPILPLGPLLAALIVLADRRRLAGAQGPVPPHRALARRLGLVPRRAPAGPVALTLAAVGINLMLGRTAARRRSRCRTSAGLAARFVFIFVWIGLGEEPGWRGFVAAAAARRAHGAVGRADRRA